MFAFSFAAWQLPPDLRLPVIITLRSFSCTVDSKTWLFISYWKCRFVLPTCRTLHLAALKSVCHLFDQILNELISSHSLWRSASFSTTLNIFVSSANFRILLKRLSSRSLMQIRNKIKPRTDPCGIPDITSIQLEQLPRIPTLCFLFFSYDVIQASGRLLMPISRANRPSISRSLR